MAFIGGSHSWRKHDHLVGHRKGVGKLLLAKGLVTYRLELVRAPTCLSRIIMSTLLSRVSSSARLSRVARRRRGSRIPRRAVFHRHRRNEAIERFAHRAHRADLVFELMLLLDRTFADVPAAGGIATAQDEELADLGEREAAFLGLSDEAQAPRRILVVKPVPGRTLAGRLDQTLLLVIT